MTRLFAAAFVCCLVAGSACGDEETGRESTPLDVIDKWKAAGLDVGEHELMKEHGFGDAACARGTVAGIETTVCMYETEEAAKAAQSAGFEHVGATTGAVLQHDKLLLVVADRKKRDKDGKIIDALTKAYLDR